MNTDRERLRHLLEKYALKSITAEETDELQQLLQHDWGGIDRSLHAEHIDWEKMYREIIGTPVMTPVPVWKKTAYRLAAAAVILVLLGAGGYFLFFNSSRTTNPAVATIPVTIKAPQTNRAMIVLADGSKLYLDSAANGSLALQGGMHITKLADGKISYNAGTQSGTLNPKPGTPNPQSEISYNTLTNPRGSKVIDMTLSDGTHIWLNAGSSVTYPVAFTGNERNVSITGEAYFEVAHNAAKPFIVTRGDMRVQVLGTHFNINAYDDEEDIKVTLLEGSVKVKSGSPAQVTPLHGNPSASEKVGKPGNNEAIIKPGEQARLSEIRDPIRVIRDIHVIRDIDLEQVMSWKNGYFQFNGNDIPTIMRQLARWYDVDIRYEGKIPERQFAGQMQRTTELSSILKILEESNVHFRVEERTITVMP